MIDGRTQLVGLIGWPVEHSLSPVMHNAAFEARGLNWCYIALPVLPGQVEAAVCGLAALGFRGANVTTPHKQTVLPALGSIDPTARALGAANTLVLRRAADGTATFSGHNTDVNGFLSALKRGGSPPGAGDRAVVVGAGGSARAVVYGLLEAGVAEIVVLDRTPERGQLLVADLVSQAGAASRLRPLPLSAEALVESVRAAGLLINATTLGMWPDVDGCIWPAGVAIPAHLTVFDLVYNPPETRLLRQARQAGARAVGGLGMLVAQGALAFELWTGQPAPVEVMSAACAQALGR